MLKKKKGKKKALFNALTIEIYFSLLPVKSFPKITLILYKRITEDEKKKNKNKK